MGHLKFTVTAKDPQSMARTGLLEVAHGTVQTPSFIVVGTQATVKAVDPRDLKTMGAQIALANTYHLMLRPGAEKVAAMGGLHKFMGWDGPMVTDSGGFQAFSLGFAIEHGIGKQVKFFPGEGEADKAASEKAKAADAPAEEKKQKLARITPHGIKFRSHLDGSRHFLTPERSIDIQEKLGADIILVLDECTSPLAGYDYTKTSMYLSHIWADRSAKAHKTDQALAGIVQGGAYEDLRKEAARFNAERPFDSYAIGGSLGDGKDDMCRILEWTNRILPDEKPRHLLGIGGVDDIFMAVERGVDMFDCISPTRLARMGMLHIRPESGGTVKNKFRMRLGMRDKDIDAPIDPACTCTTCQRFSRAYLHHLQQTGEMLFATLASVHNLHFLTKLFEEIRAAIASGTYAELKARWIEGDGAYKALTLA